MSQDGLIQISQLADGFVKSPSDVDRVHQKVTTTAIEVDPKKSRIFIKGKKAVAEMRRAKNKP